MSFDTIPGQAQAKRILQNGLRRDKLSHAYIFSGPSGSGRREMAKTLAQAVYCTERKDDACGQCLECRKVEHGNHPDLIWIGPDGASIKIDQIRELQKGLAYRSTGSRTKIYIAEEADRMTVQAANSLLKFLEEPGTDVMAILITENGHALLPTIRSRAQWIPFVPMPAPAMAAALQEEGFPAALVQVAVQLVAGLGAARELLGTNWFAEARNVMIQLAKEVDGRFPAALLTVQNKVIKTELQEHLDTFLDLGTLWFKDMVRLSCGQKDQIVYIDQVDWMSRQAIGREPGYWIRGMERTIETQKRIRSHANPGLALEKWLIDIQEG
ncbi:DNA polymerase III subunit delta' [Paenibacillus sp. J31TS4]|uniref:DNA polymerase III subunit delta' n=1 Tax=Paenibacillus sp. J31TS4 TaxID=2807195 RepID=UPI001B2EE480|nr:DNA polymerase III subunit delta' [Paenibacillus sp. J31TS4]GIP41380.1 DNA polymerase III subunit delta' [Paenibacillus sp. J31TS4]